jgi:tetratricopeptide (TPR) repeat protein
MPDVSWSALVEYATGHDAFMLAEFATLEGRYDRAIQGYLRAAEAGDPSAEAVLGELGIPVHPAPESLERAQQYLSRLQRELGSDHPESLVAEQCVVQLTMHCGLHAEALALAQNLLARVEHILGSEHRTVLALKYDIGWCTYALGDVEDGLYKLDSAVEESSRALGPRNTTTVLRRISTVNMLTEAGRVDAARERLTALEADYSDFPSWHIVMIEFRKAENRLTERQQSIGT